MQLKQKHKTFGGWTEYWQHQSECCSCPMNFAVFRPPQAEIGSVPVLYYLSGLTCSEENFIIKAGAQRLAAELGLMLVVNDTSPRSVFAFEADHEHYGLAAGYYVDATQAPWAKHYQMYSYVSQELPQLIQQHFPVIADKQSIMGHSMGGHGALIVYLRNQAAYRSISVMAAVSAPSLRANEDHPFSHYLGQDPSAWQHYDAHLLVQKAPPKAPILFDQGLSDELIERLMPQAFLDAAAKANATVDYRPRQGYGHNYFYVQSFIEEHLRWHAKALNLL